MIGDSYRMFRIMESQRHAIERNNLPRCAIKLYVGIAVSGGIHNAPELPLAGCDIDGRAKSAIGREYAFGGLRVSAASHGRFDFLQRCLSAGILPDRWSAEDDYPFRQAADHGGITFHSFDDNRTGHAIHRLLLALAMGVRVIPVESRFLIQR